ncbi:Delta(14)-sterol reductase [Aspergillus ruber CBS 135680]|uniref:Delta(14)-sterol reductase n=1 Tax=Aspergillus ruber (strain CBS 135680) TaxID=1388766 RepID=A0A017SN23_ASPRC|nr:Delta(14)-sterol reductase [Aspergillus ruber CBS 135680]EYE98196.1 Delta(14)-sterol reductase [Aspergillus ruber CBS 135680]
MALWRMLPAQEMYGTKLVHHDRPLKYRLNAFTTSLIHLTICGIGTYSQGANFIVWTYITDHYVEILMANMVISFTASLYLYIHSFGVDCRYPNPELRELAPAGHTDNQFYDFFIGRELNPRVTLPIFGEVDLKSWFGMRPGLTGWMLVDLAFMAKQYRSYGYVSSSMIFVTSVQSYYVLEGQYNEAGFLTMRDITTDGLGFMLTFGDLVWVPFLYSTQCRYLSVYPTPLSWMQMVTTSVCFVLGLYIFRASNSQKIIFRTRPSDPRVAHLSYIQTKRGTNLLTAGWWGISRHINYLGDWLQSFPFCLATGLAGYAIIPAGHAVAPEAFQMLDGRQVVQGPARGWGVLFTYLYAVYFAVLLIHREKRDDALCSEKYGSDWQRYRKIVRWRIVPGVY